MKQKKKTSGTIYVQTECDSANLSRVTLIAMLGSSTTLRWSQLPCLQAPHHLPLVPDIRI